MSAVALDSNSTCNLVGDTLIQPLFALNRRVVSIFDALPEDGAILEIALRVAIIIALPLLYLAASLSACAGLIFKSFEVSHLETVPQQGLRLSEDDVAPSCISTVLSFSKEKVGELSFDKRESAWDGDKRYSKFHSLLSVKLMATYYDKFIEKWAEADSNFFQDIQITIIKKLRELEEAHLAVSPEDFDQSPCVKPEFKGFAFNLQKNHEEVCPDFTPDPYNHFTQHLSVALTDGGRPFVLVGLESGHYFAYLGISESRAFLFDSLKSSFRVVDCKGAWLNIHHHLGESTTNRKVDFYYGSCLININPICIDDES